MKQFARKVSQISKSKADILDKNSSTESLDVRDETFPSAAVDEQGMLLFCNQAFSGLFSSEYSDHTQVNIPLDNINEILPLPPKTLFPKHASLLDHLLHSTDAKCVIPILHQNSMILTDVECLSPQIHNQYVLRFLLLEEDLSLPENSSEIQELIQKLPTNFDFRAPLEGGNDTIAIEAFKKLLSDLLQKSTEFLLENLENPEGIKFWINFFTHPTNLRLKLIIDLFQHFEKPFRSYINLVLLRLFFPPLFTNRKLSPTQSETLKSVLKTVYDHLAGLSVKRDLENRDFVSIFRTLYSAIPRKDRAYGVKIYKDCFCASEMIDWLIEQGSFESRKEALELCLHLQELGYLSHTLDDRKFQDAYLFFDWTKTPSDEPAPRCKDSIESNPHALVEMLTFKRHVAELFWFYLPKDKKKDKEKNPSLLSSSNSLSFLSHSTATRLESAVSPLE